jgi:uncharacterized protein (DUF1778 family)
MAAMPLGNRSKRRRARKGFPHRVASYLDNSTFNRLTKALEITGENMSMFIASAVRDRADQILNSRQQ